MSKYTRFTKGVFKMCDVVAQPLSNWGRQDTKGLITEYEVSYGDKDCHKADIYYKQELKGVKKPAIVHIHGGGFVGGDKKARNALCVWFANLGYFVFNINYGVAPEYRFPQGNVDAINAYNWLVDNADKYDVDVNKILVAGDSTGGYMTSIVAVTSYDKKLQEFYGVAPKVKPYAVVMNCGVYDVETVLTNKMIFNMTDKICVDLLGITTKEMETYPYKEYLSSQPYVTAEFPRTCLAYAKKDMFVPGQGEVMTKKLKEVGVYVEGYEGKRFADNHVFPLFWDMKSAKEFNAILKVFLEKVRDGEI